jgi:hypothetical protein
VRDQQPTCFCESEEAAAPALDEPLAELRFERTSTKAVSRLNPGTPTAWARAKPCKQRTGRA